MKRKLLTLATLVLAGCSFLSTEIKTSAVNESVNIVTERHDSYVEADGTLNVEQRNEAFGQAAALRSLLQESSIVPTVFGVALGPVSARHDAYVRADAGLSDLERRTYLRTTAELRALLGN